MDWITTIISMFTNTANWNIDSVLTFFSIVLVIVGGFFAYRQWIKSNKIKRTEFINQIIEKLRFDEEMVNTMYIVEYDYDWYNDDFHDNNKKLEYSIDKLLSYLSYICYIRELKNISKKEFSILRYELNRTCSSRAVQAYLWNLFHFSKAQSTECTFQYLIDYGTKNKIIDKGSFYNSKNPQYPKYLNF